jgi:hypothetical protein
VPVNSLPWVEPQIQWPGLPMVGFMGSTLRTPSARGLRRRTWASTVVPVFMLETTRTWMGRPMVLLPISTRAVMSGWAAATSLRYFTVCV